MPKTHILVIEDDEDARTMYGIMLRSWGYDVTEASTGRDGVKIAQRQPPDLILLDVMMPDLDGFGVCQALRSDPRFQTVPIIFLTALDAMGDRIKGYTIGGDDFITKGQVDYRELGVRIQAALNRTERIQQPTRSKPTGTVIGFMSLRGGVGLSTLALQLAHQASQQSDTPTILIDLAFPVGSIGLWSGVSGPRHSAALFSRHPTAIDLANIEAFSLQNVNGFSFIPAPSTLVDLHEIRMESIERTLRLLQEAGYVIILDLGRGTLPLMWKVPQQCDWLTIVTTADPTARNLATIAMESVVQAGVDARALLLLYNDITGAKPTDIGAGLPRVPDLFIPYIQDFSEATENSPLARLWAMVAASEPRQNS